MPDAIAIWSNDGTIADHPHVPATPPPPDQGWASALPSSASTGPVKAVAVARSVRGIPRSGDMSTEFNRGRYCSVAGLQSLPPSLGDGVVTN